MKESSLIKLCFVLCLIGIFLLFVINRMYSPTTVKITQIKEGMNFVSVSGEVKKKFVSEKGTAFLTLKDDTGEIKVVIFKGSMDVSNVNVGSKVEVMGEVQKYKGELEIIAKKIKLL
ncbi:MAG: OB-fold nucleic acid binding domain-containing protein [Candidatus Aenigmarchaeota archaeon]|nr:OB-fold nucleic acid binding domain-containing protein [Candidatus Aenigmarchaeota archaeon]